MDKPLTINEYAAPVEAKYGTGFHTGIMGAIIVACSDTEGAVTTVPGAGDYEFAMPLPVSGDALIIARAQVLASRRAELADRYPTLNL